jgi:hypothetical protein
VASLGDFALRRKAVYVPLTWNEVSEREIGLQLFLIDFGG